MTALIRLENVTKTYATSSESVSVLKGISLEVQANEFVAVTGPSGSGKSTLVGILGCLDQPTTGQYHLCGRDVSTMAPDELAEVRNSRIGFIFQTFNLLPYYTARANVELPMCYRGHPDPAPRADELLRRLNLAHRSHHYPHELSGGERQRVAVARAIANSPPLLIADEPTGNLDSVNSREVMTLLRQLHAGGAAIVLVTHDATVAAAASRTIRIMDGCVM